MLRLTSTNPKLSFVLGKNPENGLCTVPLRQGKLVAWYPNKTPTMWCVSFMDSAITSSFGPHAETSGNYLDFFRYADIGIIVHMIRGFLDHLLKNETDKYAPYDVPSEQTLEIPLAYFPKGMRMEFYNRLCNNVLHLTVQETEVDFPQRGDPVTSPSCPLATVTEETEENDTQDEEDGAEEIKTPEPETDNREETAGGGGGDDGDDNDDVEWSTDATRDPVKKSSGLYKIVIKASHSTVTDFIRKVYLLCMVWMSKSTRKTIGASASLDENLARKMGYLLNAVNAPYFLRKQLFLGMSGNFTQRWADYFTGPAMMFTPGTNGHARQRFIMQRLQMCANQFDTLLDFGCGDHPNMAFTKFETCGPNPWLYVAVDNDPQVQSRLRKFCTPVSSIGPPTPVAAEALVKNDRLAICGTSLAEVFPYIHMRDAPLAKPRSLVVVATEIVEHLPPADVVPTLVELLQEKWNVKMLILTTPNADFNKHYLMTHGEKRHKDHTQEYSEEQWEQLCQQVAKACPSYDCTTFPIGDSVDGCHTIQGAVFETI